MPIFDQGYQHWNGNLAGHAWRWLAITRQGVRANLKKRVPKYVLAVAQLPTILLAFVLVLWGMAEQKVQSIMGLAEGVFGFFPVLDPRMLASPEEFRKTVWTLCFDLFLSIQVFLSMFAVVVVGPGLISQDLRFNAIPLYLSRPLHRLDYFIGKLGVIGYFLGMIIIVPSLEAWICGVIFSLDIKIIRDTYSIVLSALCYGAVVVFSAGTLILALSSLSRRSIFIGVAWLAIWFISGITGSILEGVSHEQRMSRRYAELAKKNQSVVIAQPGQQMPPPQPNQGARPGPRGPGMGGFPGFHSEVEEDPEERKWFEEAKKEAVCDWKPLFSYTTNLKRVGSVFMDKENAWKKIASFRQPGLDRDRFILEYMGYQYPWYWSGAVLVGLMGISVCILNFRVKSLDRLK